MKRKVPIGDGYIEYDLTDPEQIEMFQKAEANKRSWTFDQYKEALDIAKQPNFLDLINHELDKKIVGEEEARKVIFLVMNMRNVSNLSKGTDNLIVNAKSGTGKDHLTENLFDILPLNEKEELVRTTPKVLSYTRNKIIHPDASWKKTSLRMEDVSDAVVNDDAFKVFLSANPNKINVGKTVNKGKVIEMQIEGKPSIILTIANASINDEQLRRLPNIYLDEGIDQTKEILNRQAEYAVRGISIDYDDDVKRSIELLERKNVSIPFAKELVSIFQDSTQNVIVRTAFPRFLDYIRSSAVFHQFNRKEDEEGSIIAEKQDYEYGALCLRKTTSNILMIPLNRVDEKIYNLFKNNNLQNRRVDDLLDLSEIQKLGMTDRWIRYRLNFLVTHNFLKRTSEKIDNSFKPVYFYSYNEMKEFQVPDFDSLVQIPKKTSITANSSINSINSDSSNTKKEGVNEVNEVFETGLDINKNEVEVEKIK